MKMLLTKVAESRFRAALLRQTGLLASKQLSSSHSASTKHGDLWMDMTWITSRLALGGGIWNAQTMAEVARARGSGPLDHLAGFEALQEIVASRPEDHGARMALAVAYAEEGHIDHSLNEYHRLVHHRGLPPSMLGIISDQLADLESEATGTARFHKVRGDLMMKQGQYQEAIEEYNKIK